MYLLHLTGIKIWIGVTRLIMSRTSKTISSNFDNEWFISCVNFSRIKSIKEQLKILRIRIYSFFENKRRIAFQTTSK